MFQKHNRLFFFQRAPKPCFLPRISVFNSFAGIVPCDCKLAEKLKLSRFERARVISARGLQISLGAPIKIKSTKGASPTEIAESEFNAGKTPLCVLRKYPNGKADLLDAR
jgi:DNA-directed RNA polymerase subunit K